MIPGMFASAASGGVIPPPPSFLDDLPVLPRSALSLRKMISAATVSVRVRRSSDNAEQDIGFVGNALDTAALSAFVGAGSAYVVTWYDQTGNGYHRSQATASKQPRIVDSGVYDGKLVYDGSADAMASPVMPFGTPHAHIYLNAMLPTTSGAWVLYELSSNYTSAGGRFLIYSESGEIRLGIRNTSSFWARHYVHAQSTLRQTTILLQVSPADTTIPHHRFYVDGTLQVPVSQAGSSTGVVNFQSQPIYSGARNLSSLYAPMWEETSVIYDADTSSIREDIEVIVA